MTGKPIVETADKTPWMSSSTSAQKYLRCAARAPIIEFNERFGTHKVAFCAISTEELSEIIGLNTVELQRGVILDDSQTQTIEDRYNVRILPKTCIVRPPSKADFLPYLTHTGRELEMIRLGTKPLAAFSEFYPTSPDFIDEISASIQEALANVRIDVREYVSLLDSQEDGIRGIRRLMIARSSDSWRIDAYILLLETAELYGWDDSLVRIEGYLLGYEAWETNVYIASKLRQSQRD